MSNTMNKSRKGKRSNAMTDKTTVLTIGDNAPEFNSVDFAGKPEKLSTALSEGPVVLIFLRGFG